DKIANNLVVTDLEYTRAANGKVTWFAGVRELTDQNKGGLWKNDDGKWKPVAIPGLATANVLKIVLAANHAKGQQELHAAVAGQNGKLINVWSTFDNGVNWNKDNPPGNFVDTIGWYSMSIGLSPSGRVYLGGVTAPPVVSSECSSRTSAPPPGGSSTRR